MATSASGPADLAGAMLAIGASGLVCLLT